MGCILLDKRTPQTSPAPDVDYLTIGAVTRAYTSVRYSNTMSESIRVDHSSLDTEQGRQEFHQALREAMERAKVKHAATCTRMPPPVNASVESAKAHEMSVLADVGRDVIAAFDIPVDGPGPKRVVAIRVRPAAHPKDLGRCVSSRTRELHLATRARRTERELQTDAQPDIDDLDSTAHIFLTYDDFESTHTLGVARIINLPVGGGSSQASPQMLKPTVDRFFATTLSMILEPVKFPIKVRDLLLEACHECVRRAGVNEFDLVTSAPNHVPIGAKPRTTDGPSRDVPKEFDRCDRARTYALRVPSPEEYAAPDVTDLAEEAATETRTESSDNDEKLREADARRDAAAEMLRRLDDVWGRTKLSPSKVQLANVATALVAALVPSLTPGSKSCETAVDTLVGGFGADAETLGAIARMSRAAIAARSDAKDSCISHLATIVAESPNSSASIAELANVPGRLLVVMSRALRRLEGHAPGPHLAAMNNRRGSEEGLGDEYESLDSMFQSSGPSGVLLILRVVHRVSECGEFDVPTVVIDGGEDKDVSAIALHDVLFRAAEIGLVPDPAGCFLARGGSATDSECGVAIVRLRRTGYSIRCARMDDVDALVSVEAANWKNQPEMRTDRLKVEDRIRNNPQCNLVVQDESGVCRGGVYFQMIARMSDATEYDWYDKEQARKPTGSWIQLMDIHVCQDFSSQLGRPVGAELREFAVNAALHIPGVEGVCAVTRTRAFRRTQKSTGETYEQYIARDGGVHDRGLAFHVAHGAVVVGPVQSWRPKDEENDGKGTLIRYPLDDMRSARWAAAWMALSDEMPEPEISDDDCATVTVNIPSLKMSDCGSAVDDTTPVCCETPRTVAYFTASSSSDTD